MGSVEKKRQMAPSEGERAAIGGYHPQYRLSADTILQSLRHETLEWIRLADPKAGRVDDFQIGTPGRVDGYQVKWSREGGNFTFRDLTAPDGDKPPLIAQLADGWTMLRQNHPTRRVVVHLCTNETPSVSKLLERATNAGKGSFAEFLNQAWYPSHESGTAIPTDWQPVWDDLAAASTLGAAQFAQFATDCKLEFGVALPGNPASRASSEPTFERDLRQLTEFLQSVVADPSNVIELSRAMLLQSVGWTKRLTYVSRHEFPDPTIPYREIEASADQLRVALQNLIRGYIALLGDPGSGKSTLLTKTLLALPYRAIRYYAFVPDSPDPRALRGEATSFLHDLTLSLDRAGFRTGRSISETSNVNQLLQRFHEQLQLLHQDWRDTGCKTLILVDGLDHIPRELKPNDSLLKYLPHPDQVPAGVLFVLGSQTDQLADLPNPVHHSIQQRDRRIQIARLSRQSVVEIVEDAKLPFALSSSQQGEIEQLVSGHPLALALLVNRLSAASDVPTVDAILTSTEPFGGQIDEIYHSHWRQVVGDHRDDKLAALLGKLVRLRPAIDLQWVESWAGTAVVDRLRRSLYHLFRREGRHRWYIFHNSFRLFLLRRTAESPPDGFDEDRDRRVHSEVADLCAAELPSSHWNWEEAYHRNCAGEHKKAVVLANADHFRRHLLEFRPIDAIQGDIRSAVASAGALGDFASLARLFFVGAEFTSRDQTMSDISIHELLLEIGDIEKACLQVRDGRGLRLNAKSAIEFSLELASMGLNEEARLVFELAEPIGLLKSPTPEHDMHGDQVDVLLSWATAAISFRRISEVVKLIRGSRQYGFSWDRAADQSLQILDLQNRMLSHVGYGMIDRQKWDDFESLFRELDESDLPGRNEQFWLCVHAWEACSLSDLPRAKHFVERAISLVELDELGDEELVRLSEGILRVLGDVVRAKDIFTRARAPTLTTDPGMGDRLGPYMQRFRYNRLLYAFGERRSAAELIPDASERHYQGAVFFERGLSEIARVWAMAWRGIELNGPMFVYETRPLLLLFSRDWNTDDGRAHWSLLTQHRSRFYPMLVRAAQTHGVRAVRELAAAFEREWFESERSRSWPLDAVRSITCALYRAGAEDDWCRSVFERTQAKTSDETDTAGRVSWRESQAKGWILIDERERARTLLNEMLQLSAGVGYRKDYQLDSWIEWMGLVNRVEPDGARDRIRLLASAVICMVESTEGAAATSAAGVLLKSTVDWSPLRAVVLCRMLSEKGAIAYAAGAAIIVKQTLESHNPPCELCLSYCADLLIPISTTAESTLMRTLIRRYGETRGRDATTQAVQLLVHAVNVYALPESRCGWYRGVIEGLQDLRIPLDGFEIRSAADSDSGDDWPVKLKLTDGRRLSERELSSQIRSPDDLFSLVEAEASDSYFDWTSQIRDLAGRMSADEVCELAGGLHLRHRQAMAIAALAERLCEVDDQSRAWELGLRAVECASSGGWDRYYDGGTFQAAFRALVEVDAQRGRQLAFRSFVEYLNSEWWNPLHTAMNLDRVAPIVCESVPVVEVWASIENYLQAMFSDRPLIESLNLELDASEDDSPQGALTTLACEFLGHPAHLLSEAAIRTCVDVLRSGNPNIETAIGEILRDSDARRTDALIALDAASATDASRLEAFREQIDNLRGSADQSIRWIANRLARRLNLPAYKPKAAKSIVGRYQRRAIVSGAEQLYGGSERSSFDILEDSVDPNELVSPWLEDVRAIAKGADIPFEAVLVRVVEFMRELSPESTWNAQAEEELRRRMDRAELEFPFRRPRSAQSRRAIFHVLAELADGGRIPVGAIDVYERIFRTYDAELVLRRPIARPMEISPVICPQHNEFKMDWVDGVHDSGFRPVCAAVGDRLVMAEYTALRPAGNCMPTEYRKSSLCPRELGAPEATMDEERFFPCLVRELVSTYHVASPELESLPAVVHLAYGYDTPGEGWLAFNPLLGRILKWAPSDQGFLAWEKNGQLFVETIWWNDGALHHSMPFYRKLEVGEGWLVVATQEAVDQIADQIGTLKRFGAVTREIVQDRNRSRRTKYFDAD